ncbi:hypothetical protein P3S68_011788 [Capsicum galapagoense]
MLDIGLSNMKYSATRRLKPSPPPLQLFYSISLPLPPPSQLLRSLSSPSPPLCNSSVHFLCPLHCLPTFFLRHYFHSRK